MDNTYIEQAIEHYKTNTSCYYINTLLILPVPNDIDLFIIVDVSTGTFRNVKYDLDKKKRLEKLESIKSKLRTTSTSLPIITESSHSGPESDTDSSSDSDSDSDTSYEEVVEHQYSNETEQYAHVIEHPETESKEKVNQVEEVKENLTELNQ